LTGDCCHLLELQTDSHVLSADITKISWSDWFILIGLAVSGLLAFTSMTKALKLISPNMVASLRTLELIIAYGVQSLITGESPDALSCIGGGLVLGGVLLLTFQDRIFVMFRLSQQNRDTGLGEYSRVSQE
jgi:drug/metabolite transporter (DMT)-like permease